MHSEREIDNAIDRAVREIMTVEPRPGLRRRVLAELESTSPHRFSILRFAGVAALASIAVVMFVWSRPAPDPAVQRTAARDASPAAPPATAVAAVAVTPPEAAVELPRKSVTMAQRPRRAAAPPQFPPRGTVAAANVAADVAGGAEVVDAYAAPTPPTLAPEIAIQAIRIQPLTIDRIVIAPIPPPR